MNISSMKLTYDGVNFENYSSNIIQNTDTGQLEKLFEETIANLGCLNQQIQPRFFFENFKTWQFVNFFR